MFIFILLRYFNISDFLFDYGLFRNAFNFQIYGDYPHIFVTAFLFNSVVVREYADFSFKSLFVLWPKIWSILMNVPYAHERNVYFETYLMFYKCQLNQAG